MFAVCLPLDGASIQAGCEFARVGLRPSSLANSYPRLYRCAYPNGRAILANPAEFKEKLMIAYFLFYLFCAACIIDWKTGHGWFDFGLAFLFGITVLGGVI